MEALVNFLVRIWPRLVLKLCKDPPEPGARAFMTEQFHSGDASHLCYVGFWRDNTNLPNKYHCSVIVELENLWLFVNTSARDSLIVPVAPGEGQEPLQMLTTQGAEYVAVVPCSMHTEPDPCRQLIGPVSCTVIAKRTIGLHDPRIHTAAQLLASLWECREEQTDE